MKVRIIVSPGNPEGKREKGVRGMRVNPPRRDGYGTGAYEQATD